jgi:hypothetical protein
MHAMNSVRQLLMLAQMRGSCLATLFIFLQLWVFVFCSSRVCLARIQVGGGPAELKFHVKLWSLASRKKACSSGTGHRRVCAQVKEDTTSLILAS